LYAANVIFISYNLFRLLIRIIRILRKYSRIESVGRVINAGITVNFIEFSIKCGTLIFIKY